MLNKSGNVLLPEDTKQGHHKKDSFLSDNDKAKTTNVADMLHDANKSKKPTAGVKASYFSQSKSK